ncbi:unnamed protein product [Eruca vesicaria subsp. sativa]|uniref:Cullin N-terminal domain-containing protein n=1 Tax=Eruca vesicaria subsp. sativa TaxID=29727 RepID=A0ABC8LD76_ERUVS|nr:unnamed protein product [Eruca vesicaria subsp. sativa]
MINFLTIAIVAQVVSRTWWFKESGEALTNLILEECGEYISTTLQSLAVHCNDDDPSLLLLLLEKSWLEFPKKLQFICDIAGAGTGIKLWDLGLQLFPQKLFLASQLRDKIKGKSIDMSQLENLTNMFNGSIFRRSRFLEKPFLDSTAEFYAAEAKQVLEQSPDLPQCLKYVHQRVGEEKKKCRSLPLFFIFQDELLEVVYRELLGVHARAILEKVLFSLMWVLFCEQKLSKYMWWLQGFEKLLDERFQEDLSRMYKLFSEADLVGHINDELSSYISKTGEKILKEGSTLTEF